MSTIKHIDEQISSVKNIIFKKKSLIPGIVVTMIGIALIVINYTVDSVAANPNVSSGVVLFGSLFAIGGVSMLLIAGFGKRGIAVHSPTGRKLERREIFYDAAQRDKICSLVTKGDFSALSKQKPGEGSSLMAVVYSDPGGEIAVAQVLEFIPHFYQPVADPVVFGKGEYTSWVMG